MLKSQRSVMFCRKLTGDELTFEIFYPAREANTLAFSCRGSAFAFASALLVDVFKSQSENSYVCCTLTCSCTVYAFAST